MGCPFIKRFAISLFSGNSTCLDLTLQLDQTDGDVCFAEFWLSISSVLRLHEKPFTSGQLVLLDHDSQQATDRKVRARKPSRSRAHPWLVVDLSAMATKWSVSSARQRKLSVCWNPRKAKVTGPCTKPDDRCELAARFDRLHGNCSEPQDFDKSPFLVVGRLSPVKARIVPPGEIPNLADFLGNKSQPITGSTTAIPSQQLPWPRNGRVPMPSFSRKLAQ